METKRINASKYISATLLFIKEENCVFKASRFSKIFNCSNYEKLLKDIQIFSSEVVDTYYLNYTFLGVNDLFISDKEGNGRFLGRTSFFDNKTIQDAEEHVLNGLEVINALKKSQEMEKINIGFGYFYKDEVDDENNFSLIVYSQVTKNENLEQITKLAKSRSFKEQIVHFSVDFIQLQRLKFVGITDLYGIKGPGLFEEFAEFSSYDEIISEIYSNTDLKNKFREVTIDKRGLNNL